MTDLSVELTPELICALVLMFVLTASMLGGLMRTIFVLLLGVRLLRMGVGAGLLATMAGGAAGYF